MKKLLLAIALISTTAYASGCHSIEIDADRLACYDKEAVAPKDIEESEEGAPKASKKEYEDWTVNETRSPLNDSKEVTIMRFSNNFEKRIDPAILILRCERNKTDAYIVWNEYLGSSNMKVDYRVDKEDPKSVWWNPSNDGQASFIPKPISFIKSLEGKKSIYIEVEKYRGGRTSATFSIEGIEDIIAPLRDACNW